MFPLNKGKLWREGPWPAIVPHSRRKEKKKTDSEMFLLRIISNLLVLRFLQLQLSHPRTGLSTLERLLVQIRLHLLHTISSSLLPLSASWFHGSIHQILKQILLQQQGKENNGLVHCDLENYSWSWEVKLVAKENQSRQTEVRPKGIEERKKIHRL